MVLRKNNRSSSKKVEKALARVDDKAERESYEDSTLEIAELPPLDRPQGILNIAFIEGNCPNLSDKTESKERTILDFAKEFIAEDSDGANVMDDTESIGFNCVQALKRVTVGLGDWDYRFLASYACVSSILARILPIVEIYGQAGSGKSQLLIAIGQISGNGIISGQSTGASLKNYINVIRWRDPETKHYEKSCLLLIDNMSEDSFKREEYLSSFLNGYNRSTDKTFISNGKGENIEFRTFCGKIYTTIWEKSSTELNRRTITIRTQKSDNPTQALDPEEIVWSPLTAAVKAFWELAENWEAYKILYKSYARIPKPAHSKEYWNLLRSVLVTGVVVGVWTSLDDAISDTSNWLVNALRSRTSLLETVILDAIEATLGLKKKEWDEVALNHKLYLNPRDLKDAIEISIQSGLIERPKLAQTQQILTKLGFAPGRKDRQLGYTYTKKKND